MATRLGLKAAFASRRTRVWAGGSTLVRVGTGLTPSCGQRNVSLRHKGGWIGESALEAENSLGDSKIWRISLWRVTTQYLISGLRKPG